MEKKVSIETATADVEKWLDKKKVSEKKREEKKAAIAFLIGAIEEGNLVLNEDNSFEQTLKFPKGEGESLNKLKFKDRLQMSELHVHLKNTNGTDERLLGHVVALTGQPKNIIKTLDTEDYDIASTIGLFFV